MNPKTHRKCRCCKEHKHSVDNFRMLPSGQRYQVCHSCVESPKKEEKIRCKACYKHKTKQCFTKVDNICNRCISKPETKTSLKKNKKDDGIVDRNILSFEYQNKQKLSAEQALEKAKQREKEVLSNGGRYIQHGVRAYVLKN